MQSFRKELFFHFDTRRGLKNITPDVEAALAESGIREGLVLINAMNITASVFIIRKKHPSKKNHSLVFCEYVTCAHRRASILPIPFCYKPVFHVGLLLINRVISKLKILFRFVPYVKLLCYNNHYSYMFR